MNFYRSTAHINLEALKYNLSIVKKISGQKILAMVKSNAYGHGLIEISKNLCTHVDALGVSSIQEALILSKKKINCKIIVWSGFLNKNELMIIVKYGFETIIHNFEQLDIIEKTKISAKIKVWVKIDTGMHRLGFSPKEIKLVHNRLLKNKMIDNELCYATHFSNADILYSYKTLEQFSCFNKLITNMRVKTSVSNSAGVLFWPKFSSDWIRPGISLYGISPLGSFFGKQLGLIPVMTLTSKIIAIKKILKGDTVGYASSWVCHRENVTIGIVAIGYGDGYPWHVNYDKMKVLIRGVYCQLVGRVAMDFITIDITNLHNIQIGEQVILWGEGLPIEFISTNANTSCYELPCQLTSRVNFQYYDKTIDLKKSLTANII